MRVNNHNVNSSKICLRLQQTKKHITVRNYFNYYMRRFRLNENKFEDIAEKSDMRYKRIMKIAFYKYWDCRMMSWYEFCKIKQKARTTSERIRKAAIKEYQRYKWEDLRRLYAIEEKYGLKVYEAFSKRLKGAIS